MTLQALPEISNATIVATGPQFGTDWESKPLEMSIVHYMGRRFICVKWQAALETMKLGAGTVAITMPHGALMT